MFPEPDPLPSRGYLKQVSSAFCTRKKILTGGRLFLDRLRVSFIYSHMAIQYQKPLDRTFHALGDGTRRQILSMLATIGPQSANDLRKPFDVAQPTISKHLKVLERAGLISREINGRIHLFQLETAPMKEAENWIARHSAFWEGTLDHLENYLSTDSGDGDAGENKK